MEEQMRNSAAKAERHADQAGSRAADQFAAELSDLCRKYGIGVGDGTLFEMQPDDYRHNYYADENSRLMLG
jgi:hypothetical protein